MNVSSAMERAGPGRSHKSCREAFWPSSAYDDRLGHATSPTQEVQVAKLVDANHSS
jgi:hypothetical protein